MENYEEKKGRKKGKKGLQTMKCINTRREIPEQKGIRELKHINIKIRRDVMKKAGLHSM